MYILALCIKMAVINEQSNSGWRLGQDTITHPSVKTMLL